MNQMTYQPFTFKAALQLTKPPSWTAALSAVAVGGAAAWALHGFVPFIGDNRASACWLLMLLCSLLAQSAVNTLNDYKDFIVGLDTEETITDETDASIIYNAINPRSALYFGLVLCLLAVGVGIVVAVMSVWWLVLLGAGGIIAVLFYSLGPKPLSYLPLGEVISGLVMGGIITVATYVSMTLSFTPLILAIALPSVLTIALIMLSNNTCDIERDIIAGRKTLAVLLGRTASRRLAGFMAIFTLLWMAVLAMLFWLPALALAAMAALVGYSSLRTIMQGSYDLENRRLIMGNVTSWCMLINACWAVGLLVSGLFGTWL